MRSIRLGRRTLELGSAVAMATALGIGAAGPIGAIAQQPPVDPTQVLPLRPGVSPNQGVVNAQIQNARKRFAVTSRQPHPGSPEAITHPQLDHAGSGLSALPHPQVAAPSVTPSSSSSQPGLDVSGYQGNVDWAQVAANGAQFAYVKASEGTYSTNPDFAQQYNGSYSVGLVRGAYHFANPSNSSGPAQADYFVSNGGGWAADNQTLPGALDIEYDPYGPECYGLTQSQMVDWIASFLNEYHNLTSRWATIYSTTDWWTTCTGNTSNFAANDPLWIARYASDPGPLPAGWASYTFWQFADQGTYPGDQDTFNGSHDQLVSVANNGPTNCMPFTSPGTGTHSVCGAILAKYEALGGPASFLGYPTTDETATPDGIGRYNHFSSTASSNNVDGSIYWTPSTGAWSIHGGIRAKWASLGWERSFLGYPVTDETGTPDGIGRYNHFSYTDNPGSVDGSIYWTPGTGAWSIHGGIRANWASLGWERSCLGYPVSDEFGINGGRQNNFQRGTITWSFATGQATSSC